MRKKKFTKFTEPHNLAFWKITLTKPEEVQQFLNKGSKTQKQTLKEILVYLKRFDPDFFEDNNGQKILEKLK